MQTIDPYDSVPLAFGGSTNIRLVELQLRPISEKHNFSCKLHTFSVQDAPPYKALSYVWGGPEVTESIILNGISIRIRINLFNFLCQWSRKLHSENENRTKQAEQGEHSEHAHYMWIDALCINQNDLKERGHQVSLMGNIYQTATSVTVWLGQGNEDIELAMQEIQSPTVQYREEADIPFRQVELGLKDLAWDHYWRRAWIVQEFTLARRLSIWYGATTMNPESLLSLAEWDSWVDSRSWPRMNIFKGVHPLGSLLDFKSRWHTEGTITDVRGFIDVLWSRFDCTDARDRIYSLLSLLSGPLRLRLSIQPDYTISRAALYANCINTLEKLSLEPDHRYTDPLGAMRIALSGALDLKFPET